jgi:hypothetical protein
LFFSVFSSSSSSFFRGRKAAILRFCGFAQKRSILRKAAKRPCSAGFAERLNRRIAAVLRPFY